MDNLCLRGGIRTSQHGRPSIYLFPGEGQGPKDFKHLESPQLERILVDHFNFFRSGQTHGKIHGKSVSVERTRGKEARKIMRFNLEFLNITLLEDIKANDESKAILFIELPFHDPAVARATDTRR